MMVSAERSGIFTNLVLIKNPATIPTDMSAKGISGRINPNCAFNENQCQAQLNPLITGSGIICLTRSIQPKNPMHRHMIPITIPDAAIR
jgi:hypothetical protein